MWENPTADSAAVRENDRGCAAVVMPAAGLGHRLTHVPIQKAFSLAASTCLGPAGL